MCITPDVAGTFTSHAPGRRRQHVFEFFATDADDNRKNENVEHEASGEDDKSTVRTRQNRKPKHERL